MDRRAATRVHRPDAGQRGRAGAVLSSVGHGRCPGRRTHGPRPRGRSRALADAAARAGHSSVERQAVRARHPATRGAILPGVSP
ncbi:hypothetical protein G6F62_015656 [Rhizopus arrhizus]|nr:hypothetical protein G6F62_015656 [Rhizopus arrhizus]